MPKPDKDVLENMQDDKVQNDPVLDNVEVEQELNGSFGLSGFSGLEAEMKADAEKEIKNVIASETKQSKITASPRTIQKKSKTNDQSVIEATQVFQSGEDLIGENADPMMLAIQQEIGQQFDSGVSGLRGFAMGGELSNHYSQDEVFRCSNLTKSYGLGSAYIEVIKGISFLVKENDYVVIFGPSGSGKSTLLHLLAGLEKPTRGEIKVRNQSFASFSDDDMAFYHREEIGLVFQNFNLLESLSVWENIAFPLMLSGAPLEWRRHEAMKVLQHFSMEDFANHFPNQLSGGQQQRVSLMRAIVHDPELLLIDEPTGNLDSKSASIVIEEINRLHKQENRTIILVTHSQEFLQYATRVFYIKDGTLLTNDEKDKKNDSNRVNKV